ncbi:hypothetical protein CPB84DRAFT_364084 [Gymnopilus junonius]|uniref:Uncharacterized protein n=1 Tax=Gymnopilus junonius TaxID=109634 RepID=A0A9P5NU56_GYMJU|nr:hypothetical protein CPB84DRAFT_364084 [Gymnopilus junonius]
MSSNLYESVALSAPDAAQSRTSIVSSILNRADRATALVLEMVSVTKDFPVAWGTTAEITDVIEQTKEFYGHSLCGRIPDILRDVEISHLECRNSLSVGTPLITRNDDLQMHACFMRLLDCLSNCYFELKIIVEGVDGELLFWIENPRCMHRRPSSSRFLLGSLTTEI